MLRNLILLLVLSIVVQVAKGANLKSLNQEIKNKNAKWKAGVTSVSILPRADQINLLGAPKLEVGDFSFEYNNKGRFPEHLDWRNKNGINYMSPITNQGRCGSCVAFAAIGAYEAQANIANNWPALNLNFSEQELFSCGGGMCRRGWYPFMALYTMKTEGIVDEACMSYNSGSSGDDVDCSRRCDNHQSRKTFLYDYRLNSSKTALSPDEVIDALQNGPLMARMNVYEDFMNYTGGIYSHVSGSFLGGHAVVIVGYDVAQQYWIVRNSWGKEWGEQGYFRIKFDDPSGVGRGTYSLVVEPKDGLVKIQSPDFRQVIKGTFPVEIESTVKNTQEMSLEVIGNGVTRSFIAQRQKELGRFVVNLNTKEFTDGTYQARAVSAKGTKKVVSQIKKLFIVNEVPPMELSITKPVNNATVRGKYIVEFYVVGGSVPMMKLFFHIKYPDGTIKTIKNLYPAGITLMSWKTEDSPNGIYEIWAEGHVGEHKITTAKNKITVAN